jgi:hypothetical protein
VHAGYLTSVQQSRLFTGGLPDCNASMLSYKSPRSSNAPWPWCAPTSAVRRPCRRRELPAHSGPWRGLCPCQLHPLAPARTRRAPAPRLPPRRSVRFAASPRLRCPSAAVRACAITATSSLCAATSARASSA